MMEFGLHHQNCIEGMRSLPEQAIDLTVTSPPYDDMKNWKAACHTWEGKWNAQPSKSQGGTGNYFMDKLMRMKGEEGNEDE